MTFKREKGSSRPMQNYDALPPASPEDSIESAPDMSSDLGEQAVQATVRQHEAMTAEKLTDAKLIPKAITESEWGPGNARTIDQSHGPSL